MFKGLDDIEWGRLEHAYGAASDVPALIRDLTAKDEQVVEGAIYELFGTIYHQGTVYPASVPAVPFLAEALGSMAPKYQAQLLGLLRALAEGHGYYDVHRHRPFAKETMEASWVDDAEATLSAERAIVRETTLAVFAQWDAIEAYLEAADREVRFAALHALATLGQNDASDAAAPDEAAAYLGVRPEGHPRGHWAGRLRRRADRTLEGLPDPLERAAWLRALSQIGAGDHPGLQLERASSGSGIERYIVVWSCAVAALRQAPVLPDHFAPLVADLVDQREGLREVMALEVWPWEDEFEPDLLRLFCRLSEPALEEVAAACARLIGDAGWYPFDLDALLQLILGQPIPRIPDEPCSLSPGRRLIASAFLTKPARPGCWWFWYKLNGTAAAARDQFNLPHDRRVWLKWLGLPDR